MARRPVTPCDDCDPLQPFGTRVRTSPRWFSCCNFATGDERRSLGGTARFLGVGYRFFSRQGRPKATRVTGVSLTASASAHEITNAMAARAAYLAVIEASHCTTQ
jgi:hypothetical protein